MIQKRYQHYNKDNKIVWTDWFNILTDDKNIEQLRKEQYWQLKGKLKNEFRIV
ncbi:MAG: hypothetical protein J6Y28_01675 [Acholeplasmatales bacterium]|nr:hypothetical protein [Methanobrevibacter sp.]MBP5444856.1 hypothetical protein [Acholeplasmatales bacterium]